MTTAQSPQPVQPVKTNHTISYVIMGFLAGIIFAIATYYIGLFVFNMYQGTNLMATTTPSNTPTIGVSTTASVTQTASTTIKPSATPNPVVNFSETFGNSVVVNGVEKSVVINGYFLQNIKGYRITHALIEDGIAQVLRIEGSDFQLDLSIVPDQYQPITYAGYTAIAGSIVHNLGRITYAAGDWRYVDDLSTSTCVDHVETGIYQMNAKSPCGYMSITKGGPGFYDIRCSGTNVDKCDEIMKTVDFTIAN